MFSESIMPMVSTIWIANASMNGYSKVFSKLKIIKTRKVVKQLSAPKL